MTYQINTSNTSLTFITDIFKVALEWIGIREVVCSKPVQENSEIHFNLTWFYSVLRGNVGIFPKTSQDYFVQTNFNSLFSPFRKIAKSDYWLRHVCPSVRPHGIVRLPLDGFSWKLVLQYYWTFCRENSSLTLIWQEFRILYMNTYACLW